MQSRNKPKPTAAERRHIERIAAMNCAVCRADGPSEVHEPEQGLWYAAVPLCPSCHRDPKAGFHGERRAWKLRDMTIVEALAVTIRRLMETT